MSWIEDVDSRKTDGAAFRHELKAEIAELRHEMHVGFAKIDERFIGLEAKLEAIIERRFATLLQWSFVFWCGAVAAIAALAGVLRTP